MREDFPRGRFEADITETTFDLGEYLQFLASIEESTEHSVSSSKRLSKQSGRAGKRGLGRVCIRAGTGESDQEDELPAGTVAVRCTMPGSVWKVLCTGQEVKKGDTLASSRKA